MYEGKNLTRLMAQKGERYPLRTERSLIYPPDRYQCATEADSYARQLWELDMKIQSLNWTTDLI